MDRFEVKLLCVAKRDGKVQTDGPRPTNPFWAVCELGEIPEDNRIEYLNALNRLIDLDFLYPNIHYDKTGTTSNTYYLTDEGKAAVQNLDCE